MVNISPEQWMLNLNDNMKICDISLPGTHDTCASDCNLFAKCQSLNLEKQLDIGIRFIDIRCRHINDRFKLHHGFIDLGIDFGEGVQDKCLQFLKKNPSEAIFIMISPEYKAKENSKSFEEVFQSYIKDYSQYWYLKAYMPTIGEIRGKIVLLRRFAANDQQLGIDMSGWKYDAEFAIQNHHEFKFFIQDKHSLSRSNKWTKISQSIDQKNRQNEENTWCLHYCSSTSSPLYIPRYNASKVNKKLFELLQSIDHPLKGTFILDFARDQIVSEIFSLNFFKTIKI